LDIVIEPLGRHHDRARFSCGRPDLDNWFRLRASQDEKRDVTRVFVAVSADLGVVGFYNLSALSLSLDDLPAEVARKLPRYPAVPAALIGRLARDERVRGQSMGELLLADAIQRILGAARSIAVFAIVVDAKDEEAVDFYRAFGFRVFPLHPKRLFLLASTATAALR
jgi:ribosomal protein S18 acetylase RimI-like enzyme